jgi:hypothetical protein
MRKSPQTVVMERGGRGALPRPSRGDIVNRASRWQQGAVERAGVVNSLLDFSFPRQD